MSPLTITTKPAAVLAALLHSVREQLVDFLIRIHGFSAI
jgi:hypothetical protein